MLEVSEAKRDNDEVVFRMASLFRYGKRNIHLDQVCWIIGTELHEEGPVLGAG